MLALITSILLLVTFETYLRITFGIIISKVSFET